MLGENALTARRLDAGLGGAALASRRFAGLGEGCGPIRLRAGLGIATDILRYEPLAVHSAKTYRANAR